MTDTTSHTPIIPAVGRGPNVSATHLLFVLWGIFGGFLCVVFTPQLLIAPTILLGGLLFLGFAAILSYRGAAPPTRGSGFLQPIVPTTGLWSGPADNTALAMRKQIDSTMRSESEMKEASRFKGDNISTIGTMVVLLVMVIALIIGAGTMWK